MPLLFVDCIHVFGLPRPQEYVLNGDVSLTELGTANPRPGGVLSRHTSVKKSEIVHALLSAGMFGSEIRVTNRRLGRHVMSHATPSFITKHITINNILGLILASFTPRVHDSEQASCHCT